MNRIDTVKMESYKLEAQIQSLLDSSANFKIDRIRSIETRRRVSLLSSLSSPPRSLTYWLKTVKARQNAVIAGVAPTTKCLSSCRTVKMKRVYEEYEARVRNGEDPGIWEKCMRIIKYDERFMLDLTPLPPPKGDWINASYSDLKRGIETGNEDAFAAIEFRCISEQTTEFFLDLIIRTHLQSQIKLRYGLDGEAGNRVAQLLIWIAGALNLRGNQFREDTVRLLAKKEEELGRLIPSRLWVALSKATVGKEILRLSFVEDDSITLGSYEKLIKTLYRMAGAEGQQFGEAEKEEVLQDFILKKIEEPPLEVIQEVADGRSERVSRQLYCDMIDKYRSAEEKRWRQITRLDKKDESGMLIMEVMAGQHKSLQTQAEDGLPKNDDVYLELVAKIRESLGDTDAEIAETYFEIYFQEGRKVKKLEVAKRMGRNRRTLNRSEAIRRIESFLGNLGYKNRKK